MIYVLIALAFSTLGFGLWVTTLMMDNFLARETVKAKDKIIHDQKVYIEINLGVLRDQARAITSAERALEELPQLRKELQFSRAMNVEKPNSST